jgi:hypothetical protein
MTTDDRDLPEHADDPFGLDGDEVATVAATDRHQPRALAEQLFVHGVLSHLLADGDRAVERGITGAMATIDRRRRRWPLVAMMALAAAVAAVTLLLWPRGEPRSELLAAAERLASVAAQDVDRSYHITATSADRPQRTGRITLRGSSRFVVSIDGPLNAVTLGFDGSESWLVPPFPRLPVRRSPGIGRARESLAGGEVRLPFVQLAELLSTLTRDHELLPLPAADAAALEFEAIPGLGAGRSGAGPTVRVRAQANGVVARLELTWDPVDPVSGMERVVLTLIDEERRSDDFYRHAAHHAAGRAVVEFR